MEQNIFIQLLHKAKEEKKLISISTDKEETDKFSAGFVISIDEETLLLNSINPEGIDDGFIVININDIYIIDYDDIYLKQLHYIHENSQELNKKIEFNLSDSKTTDTFYKILDKCQENGILISVNLLYGTGHFGFIKEIDNEFVLLQSVNEIGKEDGVTCFKITDIVRIFIDDKRLRKIKLLSKLK